MSSKDNISRPDFLSIAKECTQNSEKFDFWKDKVWEYQLQNNPIIQKFSSELGTSSPHFLAINFFKKFDFITKSKRGIQKIFESSGTTQQTTSKHFLFDKSIYDLTAINGFFHFFKEQNYSIFALLPSYLERKNSSLVFMVKRWIESFGTENSGFFLNNFEELHQKLQKSIENSENILLIGVSFALLDFSEKFGIKLPENSVVMETGGMKGRRKEITRNELHSVLETSFGISKIASEYGMTELLSQAYAVSNGKFKTPPWMKVFITDINLPNRILEPNRTGRINFIDLANIDSCAFIQTDDLGRMHKDGSFEVLGRIDYSDIRGCNLLYHS